MSAAIILACPVHVHARTIKMVITKKRKQDEPPTTSSPKAKAAKTKDTPKDTAEKRVPASVLEMEPQLALIASSTRTPYEKRVWTALCHIPRGHFTTYGLLAAHLGSSPRAVGNALRRNPFAPEVPCHRVVATGGALGGFKGKWPKDGEGITLDEKRGLLKGEGVKLDGKGKVLGTPWAFV